MDGLLSLVQRSGWRWLEGDQISCVRLLIDGVIAGLCEPGYRGLGLFCVCCLEFESSRGLANYVFVELWCLDSCLCFAFRNGSGDRIVLLSAKNEPIGWESQKQAYI